MPKRIPFANARAAKTMGENLEHWRRLLGVPMRTLEEQAQASPASVRKVFKGDPSVSVATFLSVLRSLKLMDAVVDATDPFNSELARLRSEEHLPTHVYPKGRKEGER